jgi:hypothetical protein
VNSRVTRLDTFEGTARSGATDATKTTRMKRPMSARTTKLRLSPGTAHPAVTGMLPRERLILSISLPVFEGVAHPIEKQPDTAVEHDQEGPHVRAKKRGIDLPQSYE